MKKTYKILAVMLTLIFVLCFSGCMRAKAFSSVGTREGNYVYFGSFPQTIKADDVTISGAPNKNGYFTGSDGNLYAPVVATPYANNYQLFI